MGRGWRGPEEEHEAGRFFYIEVEADADGGEVARRHLLAHVVDGLDDVGEGEGVGHDAGGEEAEVRRLERKARGEQGRIRPREARGHGTEVTEDPGSGALGLAVPIRLDELPVLPPAFGGDSYERHTHPQ